MNKAIKKIELDLGGKTVSLTPQQAQNLKDALDELFGKEIIRVTEKEYVPYPMPYPQPYPAEPCLRPYYWVGTNTDTGMAVGGLTGNYTFNNGTLRLTG